MGEWQIKHCSERFLIHHQSPRLVILNVDGQAGWTFERDVEEELRSNLLQNTSWQNWKDAGQACQNLETRAAQAAQRIITRHTKDFEQWGGTTLTAIGMIADSNYVQWFGAGSFKARIFRDGDLIREFGTPLPSDYLDLLNTLDTSKGPRKANILDWVIIEGGFASVHDPKQILMEYGEFEMKQGDELIIAKRSFFNGYECVDSAWKRYQDPAIDWSEFENKTTGSKKVHHPDILLAQFA